LRIKSFDGVRGLRLGERDVDRGENAARNGKVDASRRRVAIRASRVWSRISVYGDEKRDCTT